jgi:parallel beta-helix repeat protein
VIGLGLKSTLTRTFALIFISLIASSIVAIQPTNATSRTIVVPDDYPTINAAIGNAVDGDTIFVRRGTYNEVLVIDKALSLKGEDKETTVINGNNTATVILIRHDNVEVTGFTVIYDETPNTPKSVWMWSTRLIGVHLLSVKNCNIFGNKISDCGGGIWLYDSHQNSVTDNYVFRNDYGIRVEASNENNIAGNTITGNWGGLWLISASSNKFTDNSMTNNARNFGTLSDQPNKDVNNVDTSNMVDGKPIYYWVGVSDQTIPSDAGCVILVNCVGVKVQELNLVKNLDAIILVYCWNTVVMNNIIAETNGGITTYNSFDSTIMGNNINSGTGITANGTGTKIINNIITASAIGVGTDGYYQEIAGNTIEITEWQGYMIKCSGSYTNITRNKLAGTSYTYSIIDGPNNVFYENAMTNSYDLRVSSDGNLVAKNNVTGITISEGSGNVVCANRITNGLGLHIYGHNNECYANEVENNNVGVTVSGREAASSGNTIYHNNFINNEQQVKKWGANPINVWDNGSEGNYWSDYNGSDLNMDGIGDTPYLIKGKVLNESLGRIVEVVSGQDNYPLMAPYDISSVNVELPEWEYTSPSPSPLPSPSPEPTPFTSPSPSPLPSQEPTSTPEQQPEPFSTTLVVAASGVTAAVITIGLLVYLRKRKH